MKVKVDFKYLLDVIIFAIVFELPIFNRISSLFSAALFIIQVTLAIVCVLVMLSKKQLHFGKYEALVGIYLIWGFVSTFITSSIVYVYLRSVAVPILMAVIVCHWLFRGDYTKSIRYIAKYYAFIVWTNLFLMIVFRSGLVISSMGSIKERANWLFGSKNNIVYILPFLLLIFGIDSMVNQRKGIGKLIRNGTMIALLVSFSSMGESGFSLFSGSTTAMLMMVLYFLLLVIFGNEKVQSFKIYSLISIKNISVLSILLMLVITIVSQGSYLSNDHIVYILLKLAGKGISFSGRASVWNSAIISFWNSPIFGIGMEQKIFITYNNLASTNTSLYSFWFTILVRFGIVGLLGIVYAFSKTEDRKKRSFIKHHAYICFLLMMIGGLMYPLDWKNIFLVTTVYCICNRKELKLEKGI